MSDIIDKKGKLWRQKEVLQKLKGQVWRKQTGRLCPKKYYNVPKTVQIDITHNCNLKCAFCYNDSRFGKFRELSDDAMCALAKETVGLEVFKVTLSGCEIFLRKRLLFRLLEIFGKSRTIVTLLTNGTLLDAKTINELLRYKNCIGGIQISIDGYDPDVHDKLRGRNGAWELSLKAAKHLVDAGFDVALAYVITPENHKNFEEYVKLAFLLNIRTIRSGFVLPLGRGTRPKAQFSKSEYLPIRRNVADVIAKYSSMINITNSPEIEFYHQFLLLEPISGMLILPNGDVKTGCIHPNIFGNVATGGVRMMWDKIKDLHNDREYVKYFVSLGQKCEPVLGIKDDTKQI